MGIDRRTVIDSLRLDTQTIWLGLIEDEKRRSFVISFVTGRSFVAEFRRRARPSSTRRAHPGRSTSWRGGSVTSRSPRRRWRCITFPADALGAKSRRGPRHQLYGTGVRLPQDRPSSGEEPDEAGADSSGPRASWRRSASKRRDHRAERCRVRGPVHARIDHEGRSLGGAGPRSESRQSGLWGCSSAAASLPRRPLQPV